ncbi:MAG: hypothetical protein CMD02_03330 [Flavobacteriales bacterium]|nr:hypothetical protein [Flavobacteriales bacterium]|tara:strand:+ start:25345 stop:26265 length:921 start_codon:yes stop_codon:yes gene_type:complete
MKFKYIVTATILLMFSCNSETPKKKILSENTGKQNEVILVIDDSDWEGFAGVILREIFEFEIDGLPQPEQIFNLVQINTSEFSRFFRTHKNIMFVGSDYKDSYTKNKWAKSQIVMYLNSNSNEREFKKSCTKSFNFLNRKELENIKHSYKRAHNTEARKHLKESFGIDLFLPTEYSVSLKQEGLFVADFHSFNEKQDLLKYILVYEFSPNEIDSIQTQIINFTDSILKDNIKGSIDGTFVQLDRRMPLSEIDGTYKGMWTLKNGFMAGPFIMKSRYIGDRIIVSLGLVFYPNEKKRDYVRTFEAIL